MQSSQSRLRGKIFIKRNGNGSFGGGLIFVPVLLNLLPLLQDCWAGLVGSRFLEATAQIEGSGFDYGGLQHSPIW